MNRGPIFATAFICESRAMDGSAGRTGWMDGLNGRAGQSEATDNAKTHSNDDSEFAEHIFSFPSKFYYKCKWGSCGRTPSFVVNWKLHWIYQFFISNHHNIGSEQRANQFCSPSLTFLSDLILQTEAVENRSWNEEEFRWKLRRIGKFT